MLVVDDDYLVRMGLRETVDWASRSIQIVADAANGREALQKALFLRPDIILTDVKMPVMDGLTPVSYTHLDVYKRQLLDGSMFMRGIRLFCTLADRVSAGIIIYHGKKDAPPGKARVPRRAKNQSSLARRRSTTLWRETK